MRLIEDHREASRQRVRIGASSAIALGSLFYGIALVADQAPVFVHAPWILIVPVFGCIWAVLDICKRWQTLRAMNKRLS